MLWKQFIARFNLHGFADLHRSSLRGKVFWGTVIMLFAVVATVQTTRLILDYVSESTGTLTSSVMPTQLPNIIVCPLDWAAANRVTGKELRYMNGFFPIYSFDYMMNAMMIGDESHFGRDFSDEKAKARSSLAGMGSSLASLAHNLSYAELNAIDYHYSDVRVLPMGTSMKSSYHLNWHGYCEKFSTEEVVNGIQMRFTGAVAYIAPPSDSYWELRNVSRMLYDPEDEDTYKFLFSISGTEDTVPLIFPKYEVFEYGHKYTVKFSPKRIIRQNKRKAPCANWALSDQIGCIARRGNADCKAKQACTTFIPSTPNFPEENDDDMCNLFDLPNPVLYKNLCIFKTISENLTTDEWGEVCPKPCVEEWFDFSYQIGEKADEGMAWIDIRAEGGGGFEVREYFTMTPEGLLSGIGGTLGLWLGASFLSVIQAIYLLGCARICGDSNVQKNGLPQFEVPAHRRSVGDVEIH